MPGPVGLLLVHGIGTQQPGHTLDGFLGGMRLAYGARLRVDRHEAGHAVLAGVGRTVHVYEVYWARLLQGDVVEGTFDKDRLREWAWFPRLYANENPALRRSARLHALADSFGLAVVAALVSAGLFGAGPLAAAVQGWLEAMRGSLGRDVEPRPRRKGRTAVDTVMDEIVGDVLNYVHGVTGAFPPAKEGKTAEQAARNATIAANVGLIESRFVDAVRRAREAGCEELQVLAHSLGTVVAFRGLYSRGDAPSHAPDGPVLTLTRFHTIGSPLEKFRAFWWRVLDGCERGPGVVDGGTLLAQPAGDFRWDNFYSPFDLVSGIITPVAGWPLVRNHRAAGLGGLVSAHVAYHGNPRFVAFVGEAVTGEPAHIAFGRLARLGGRVRAILETVLAPAVVLGLSLLGFVTMVGFAWLTGLAVSRPLAWVGLTTLATIVQYYIPASIFFVMTIGDMIIGRSAAGELHQRYWTRRR